MPLVRRSVQFDFSNFTHVGASIHMSRTLSVEPSAFQIKKTCRRFRAASGFAFFLVEGIVPSRNEPEPEGAPQLLRRKYAAKGRHGAYSIESKFFLLRREKERRVLRQICGVLLSFTFL